MATFDWSPYSMGGALRPDSFSGMDPGFLGALEQMFTAAPDDIRQHLRVKSGYRSVQRQEQLWADALKKYGSPEAARKWVAPPGRSQHNHGNAADLGYLNPAAQQWAHANAKNFGLHFPLSNENWHIERIGARGGHNHAAGRHLQAGAAPVAAFEGGPQPNQFAPEPKNDLASMFANMAPDAGGPDLAGEAAPQVANTGDVGATIAAQQGADMARMLPQQFMPNIDAILGRGTPKSLKARGGVQVVG